MKHTRFHAITLLFSLFLLTVCPPVEATFAQADGPRRANIPYFDSDITWAQTAIFWFGQNEQGAPPSRNYADVRLGYTASALVVRVTVADYYLWYDATASAASDLTQYETVALYLDTAHDRAAAPQTDDYWFLIGARLGENIANYMRQARGNGSAWNAAWTPPVTWSAEAGMSWYSTGPNNNSADIDFGWTAIFTIPWGTLELSGRPADGTVWGLGLRLYDRDDNPPGGYLAPERWPETFSPTAPSTWGELAFNPPAYDPPPAIVEGSTLVRRATEADTSVVQDAWLGGGAWCAGGHHGGGDVNHGGINPDGTVKDDERELFVGSEVAVTHLPCFNKSFLRFGLDAVPTGKTIISATLTLHHWGNSGDPYASKDEDHPHDSYVWLYSIADAWSETGITWNNAPLAQENLDVVHITPLSAHPGWPGIAYTWDATQAVAAAYAAGQPVSLAIYDSASQRNTSKYLVSSETGDWNAAGRPTLTVVWGRAAAQLTKSASHPWGYQGDLIAYTLRFLGTGNSLTLSDALPGGVSWYGNLQWQGTSVAPVYNSGQHRLTWSDSPALGQEVTIRYSVTIATADRQALVNSAQLSEAGGASSTARVTVIANPALTFLPLILKAH